MKITLIRPSLGRVHADYNLDEGAMEPLQLALIAGLIKEPDEVVMYDDRVEEVPFDEATDIVAISVDSFGALRAYEIAGIYRKKGIPVILGGMHVTLVPDEASRYADTIVMGDAEPIWNEVLDDARNNCLKARYNSDFNGAQIGCYPDRSIYKGKKYLPVSLVQFSRGCKFACTFCAVSKFFNNQHATRNIDEVIHEIEKDKLKTNQITHATTINHQF